MSNRDKEILEALTQRGLWLKEILAEPDRDTYYTYLCDLSGKPYTKITFVADAAFFEKARQSMFREVEDAKQSILAYYLSNLWC